jgi:hypothetical protein
MILIEYIYAFIGLLVIGYWLFVLCSLRYPERSRRVIGYLIDSWN